MAKKTDNLCIIQARLGSTRLPGKVLLKVGKKTLLQYEIERLQQAKNLDKIVIATGDNRENDAIAKLCRRIKVDCFRGSESDVLGRYYQCSLKYPRYKNIIRITGDCPLIDPAVVDEVIEYYQKNHYDYVSNVVVKEETYPDGMDVEIFSKNILFEAARKEKDPFSREHINIYMLRGRHIKRGSLSAGHNWAHFRFTVDYKEDFEVIKFLVKNCKLDASYLDYISILTKNPEIMVKNMHIIKNGGIRILNKK